MRCPAVSRMPQAVGSAQSTDERHPASSQSELPRGSSIVQEDEYTYLNDTDTLGKIGVLRLGVWPPPASLRGARGLRELVYLETRRRSTSSCKQNGS
jgi:hypothetical protein